MLALGILLRQPDHRFPLQWVGDAKEGAHEPEALEMKRGVWAIKLSHGVRAGAGFQVMLLDERRAGNGMGGREPA